MSPDEIAHMLTERCGGCAFFSAQEGECRRFAPRVIEPGIQGERISTIWPRVDATCWCGEWRSKENF